MYLRDINTNLITFGDKLTEVKTTRYMELRDAGVEIHKLLKENLLLFYNVPLVDPNLSKLFSLSHLYFSYIIIIVIIFYFLCDSVFLVLFKILLILSDTL